MSRRLESGLIRIPLLAIRLQGTSGENSGPMKIRGAIATPRHSRLKITKEPQLFRLRDELLLIPVNAQLEYRKRRAEGADKNTTHHPRINRSSGAFPVSAKPTHSAEDQGNSNQRPLTVYILAAHYQRRYFVF